MLQADAHAVYVASNFKLRRGIEPALPCLLVTEREKVPTNSSCFRNAISEGRAVGRRETAGIGDLLSSYAWPCEVRELHNVIERLCQVDGESAVE